MEESTMDIPTAGEPPNENASHPEREEERLEDALQSAHHQEQVPEGPSGRNIGDDKSDDANLLGLPEADPDKKPLQESNLLDLSPGSAMEQVMPPSQEPNLLEFSPTPPKAMAHVDLATENSGNVDDMFCENSTEQGAPSEGQVDQTEELPTKETANEPSREKEEASSDQFHESNLLDLPSGEPETDAKKDAPSPQQQETNLLNLPEVPEIDTPAEWDETETPADWDETEGEIPSESPVASALSDQIPDQEVNKETVAEGSAEPLVEAPAASAFPEPTLVPLNGGQRSESQQETSGEDLLQGAPEGDTSPTQETPDDVSPPSEERKVSPEPKAKKATDTAENVAGNDRDSDCENAVLLVEMQSSLQENMQLREEAEERARIAEKRVRQYEKRLLEMSGLEEEVEKLHATIEELNSDKSNMEYEMNLMEQSRDEHERKAIVLSNRLNAAKKKEGIKANLVEELEGENKEMQNQLSTAQKELIMVTAEKESLELEVEAVKKKCVDRVKSAETALEEEHRLNEERKKKMKLYIEAKAEELRVAKAYNDELQVEVEQTQISLRETNDRWKQLHAQWVQSQTRNRELQRDLNRIKKDSDHLHKVGDNLEMKLNRSAEEAEEHKNKRLTAKHELMTILRTLEAERSVSSKLRDSIKFTFTPKALSQQQLLNESLQDFESQLMKLSRRLGKPLPPQTGNSAHFQDDGGSAISTQTAADGELESGDGENGTGGTFTNGGSKRNRSEIDSNHLLSNLENETQRVSQCIMALMSDIERMHVMLDEAGDRNCVSALTDILTGVQTGASSAPDETAAMTGGTRNRMSASRYGPVPSS